MSEAKRDQNRVPSIITVSSIDGFTTKPATYTPITGVDPVNMAIVDGSGNQVTSFGGGTEYTDGGVPPAHPVAATLVWSDGSNWQTVSSAKPLPVSTTFPATQDVNLTKVGGSAISIGQQLAAASLPVILPAATITTLTPPAAITGFATETTLGLINAKLVSGTDIGDVTINNSTGASAVNIQDGGNIITVDGTVLLGANTGVDIGKLTANQSVNVAQINGVTTLMGAGNTGTGSQRVTIATDQVAVASKAAINTYVDGSIVTLGAKADAKSTATDTTAITMMQVLKQISASVQAPPGTAVTNAGTFAVQATLAAETTKVIGTVRTADGSGNLLTSTSQALDVNIKSGKADPTIPTASFAGQKTVSVTNTAVAIATSQAVSGVIVQALAANTDNIFVGPSTVTTANGFELQPGQATSVAIDNLSKVYINGTAADGVCFIGS